MSASNFFHLHDRVHNTPAFAWQQVVRAALDEDLGDLGDTTTYAVVPHSKVIKAVLRSRERGVLCGIPAVQEAVQYYAPTLTLELQSQEGSKIEPHTTILTLEGRAHDIFAIERVVLNILQHLSGIASCTALYVDRVRGTKARILDTRKTLPGLRTVQKYAVRVGGGYNHRFGLYDAILIKDNHLACVGSVTQAVQRARVHAPWHVRIGVELDDLRDLEAAIAAGAHWVLLDNMTPGLVAQAVSITRERVPIEVSGNITLDTVHDFALAGADAISIGRLTHSVTALDLGLDILEAGV